MKKYEAIVYMIYKVERQQVSCVNLTIFTCVKRSCEKSLIDFEYSSFDKPMISFSGPKSSINAD